MGEKKEAPKFGADELIKHAPGIFGVQPEILAGALYGVAGEISTEEAQKRLNSFLAKEVKK